MSNLTNEDILSLLNADTINLVLLATMEWAIEKDENEFPEIVYNAFNKYFSSLHKDRADELASHIVDVLRAQAKEKVKKLEESGMSLDDIQKLADNLLVAVDETLSKPPAEE